MSLEEFYLFNELLSSNFGVCFSVEKKELLEARLRTRLRALNLGDFHEYYLLVKFCLHTPERIFMIRDVINHETHFFRHTTQLQTIFDEFETYKRNLIVPGNLRLLVAGCSSGEEAYTLRILAHEQRQKLFPTNLHIDAFDIDLSRVEAALNAEYNSHSVLGLTQEQIRLYFDVSDPNQFKLKAPYRKNVNFSYGNILDFYSFKKDTHYDVIICRNVFIYFAEESIIAALKNFARCLQPGGLLILGFSESIIGLSKYFESVRIGDFILYRRTSAAFTG